MPNRRFAVGSLVIFFLTKSLVLAYLSGLLAIFSPLLIPSTNTFYQWLIFFTYVFTDFFVIIADNIKPDDKVNQRSLFIILESSLIVLMLASFLLVTINDMLAEHEVVPSFALARNAFTNLSIFLSLVSLCCLINKDKDPIFEPNTQSITWIQSFSSLLFLIIMIIIKSQDTHNGWSIGTAENPKFALGYYFNVIFIFCCLELVSTLVSHFFSFEREQKKKVANLNYPLVLSIFTDLFIFFWGLYSYKPNKEHNLSWDYWVFAIIILLFNLVLQFEYITSNREVSKVILGRVGGFLTCLFTIIVAYRDARNWCLLLIVVYLGIFVSYQFTIENYKKKC